MMWYTAGRNIITHVCCSVCSSMFGHLLHSLPPDELRWPLATLRRAERQTYSNFLSPVCCGEVGTLSRFPTMHTEPKNGWHTQTYRVCCILSHLNVMKLYLWRFSWRITWEPAWQVREGPRNRYQLTRYQLTWFRLHCQMSTAIIPLLYTGTLGTLYSLSY